ncbi:hypothetical protein HanRHA438_Chr11g0501921 [Helianthus annuus]|uniref:Uncharacterized protein n=1 Tax=Helianthus annuus TaxID=4232 RepID=A0A9K3HNT3_HELAN|nr:hypothetical protein HanXRQr2_Chr11g0489171 [Helianthus annuus]KAJ0501440.1 putative B3 domain-containing protein REM16 [Helianthus annuus]KAJ0509242.1 hypothetical protein HanIR_Chr11g0526611 [Helianthus annuus]KAJ0517350.1 putative B3 domain-containing protein REM16 [Helianthus annuus]KAJ0685360.1 putative B3 domain-containing protein REM16 [Helianthus annuus]
MQFSDLIEGPITDQIECPCMGMDHSMLTVHRSASIFLSVGRASQLKLCYTWWWFRFQFVFLMANTAPSGMIGQIVRVVDQIKRCKITRTKEDFDRWEKSLNSFELLGMKVGFLRDKVHTLATLVFVSVVAVDIKQYLEARNEHKRAEDEIKKVAAKLKELKGEAIKFAGIAGSLKHKVEKYEHKGGG